MSLIISHTDILDVIRHDMIVPHTSILCFGVVSSEKPDSELGIKMEDVWLTSCADHKSSLKAAFSNEKSSLLFHLMYCQQFCLCVKQTAYHSVAFMGIIPTLEACVCQ